MKPINPVTPFLPITYFVHENWRRDAAGTSTFVRMVEPEWRDKRGIQFVDLPFDPGSTTGGVVMENNINLRNVGEAACTEQCRNVPCRDRPIGDPVMSDRRTECASHIGLNLGFFAGLRLFLGYIRRFRDDVRFLKRVKKSVTGDVLLTNQFGCETLPIALRWVFPPRTILAIAHTHPGQDAAACHPVRRWVEQLCYRCVDDVVYNSQAVKELWARKLRCAEVKGRVIHHGLPDAGVKLPSDYPTRSDGGVDFVYIARFYSWKGQEGFLRAWKEACKQGMTHGRAIFVGDGERLEAARALSIELGIAASVVFMGGVPDGASWFSGADVAVLLSAEPEAFGFVLLEAMRAGLPILASRLGGIPEVVEDQVNGVLVDPLDTAAVAQMLCHLAGHPEERKRMGLNGRRRWEQEFSLARMLAEYDALFESKRVGC